MKPAEVSLDRKPIAHTELGRCIETGMHWCKQDMYSYTTCFPQSALVADLATKNAVFWDWPFVNPPQLNIGCPSCMIPSKMGKTKKSYLLFSNSNTGSAMRHQRRSTQDYFQNTFVLFRRVLQYWFFMFLVNRPSSSSLGQSTLGFLNKDVHHILLSQEFPYLCCSTMG